MCFGETVFVRILLEAFSPWNQNQNESSRQSSWSFRVFLTAETRSLFSSSLMSQEAFLTLRLLTFLFSHSSSFDFLLLDFLLTVSRPQKQTRFISVCCTNLSPSNRQTEMKCLISREMQRTASCAPTAASVSQKSRWWQTAGSRTHTHTHKRAHTHTHTHTHTLLDIVH